MDESFSTDWEALRLACDKLKAQIGDHPEISVIDIGMAPQSQGLPGVVVLRVHVHRQWTQQKIPIPDRMDGIRVIVMTGDYQFESVPVKDLPAHHKEEI